jgi:6,7-dimethyl-8-ribityllumazine synthase
MVQEFSGEMNAEDFRFGIVVSRFNNFITEPLLEGAVKALKECGASEEQVDVVLVPGAFEIPMAAKKLCATGKYDAVICLGAVIRGATPHFDFVAGETARGVGALSREFPIPVLFGVLTTDNVQQATERAGAKNNNKGRETALAAIEMVNLFKKI